MKNDLNELPWDAGQFIQVENYLEVAGVLDSHRIYEEMPPSFLICERFKTLSAYMRGYLSRVFVVTRVLS